MSSEQKKPFYNISVSQKEDNTHIWIHGFIGESIWSESTSAKEFIDEINNITTSKITVLINSRGGSVADGIAIFNALLTHKAEVTTINAATAMSIASIILQAGDKRLAFSNAMTMVHDCSSYGYGNSKAMREQADVLDKFNELLAITYKERGVKQDNIDAMLDGSDHYYNAMEAKKLGLIDDIAQHQDIAACADTPIYPDHLSNHLTDGIQPAATTTKETAMMETKKEATGILAKVKGMFAVEAKKEDDTVIDDKTTNEPEQPQAQDDKDIKAQLGELSEALTLTAEQVAKLSTDKSESDNKLQQSIDALNTKFDTLNSELEKETGNQRPVATGGDTANLADC